MSAKSRSSNGFWPSTMNLFKRLKPRQRGKCLGVASGKGLGAFDVVARTVELACSPRPAAATPKRRTSRRVEDTIRGSSGMGGVGSASPGSKAVHGERKRRHWQSQCHPVRGQGNSEAGRGFLAKGAGFSDGAGADLDGGIGANQPVVNGEGLGGLPVVNQVLGTAEQSFGNSESLGGFRAIQVFLQGFGCGCGSDPAQGVRRRPGDRGIGVLQEPRNRFNCLGVAPYSQAADDADQRPALELAKGRAKCFVNGRVRDGLQSIPSEVRELLVAQERCQGCDALLGAESASWRQASAFSLSEASDLFTTAISLASCSLSAGGVPAAPGMQTRQRQSGARQARRWILRFMGMVSRGFVCWSVNRSTALAGRGSGSGWLRGR